jgi:hypothetical protein
LYYIAYVKSKKSTDYTGLESYVHEKLQDENTTWFPFNRAISLSDVNDENDEENMDEVV